MPRFSSKFFTEDSINAFSSSPCHEGGIISGRRLFHSVFIVSGLSSVLQLALVITRIDANHFKASQLSASVSSRWVQPSLLHLDLNACGGQVAAAGSEEEAATLSDSDRD